jgi:hypothetical protein
MKKIFLYFCFLIIFSCSGFKPVFSTKDLAFYISEIENTDSNKTTKQIITNIRSYNLDKINKKNYSLKINSKIKNDVTSRDSKGDPLTYRITISAEVKIFRDISNDLFDSINIIKDFTYNYQTNQFELEQYKRNIVENLIIKITEEIILHLQLM